MSFDTSRIIMCPSKPDLSKDVYGSDFTADALFYLRMRDAKSKFAIDTLTNDAWRNGLQFKTSADEAACTKRKNWQGETPLRVLKKNEKWAIQFGWSLVVFLDNSTKDLNDMLPAGQVALGIQAFHPYVKGVGGVVNWDKDPITGMPTKFYIKAHGGALKDVPIDASRCMIRTHGDEWNGWQGYSGIGALYDPAIGLRLYQGTALRRARDYATTRQLIVCKNMPANADQKLTDAIKAEIKVMMGDDIPHTVVFGDWGTFPVASPLATEEQKIVLDLANKDAAISQSIAVTDMLGGEGGNATSVNANQAMYFMTAKDIQNEGYPFIQQVLERLGINVTGFKTATELDAVAKNEQLSKLYDTYGKAPEELKDAIAIRIEAFYLQEFGQVVKIIVRPTPEPTDPLAEAGNEGEGSKPAKAGLLSKIKGALQRGKDQ